MSFLTDIWFPWCFYTQNEINVDQNDSMMFILRNKGGLRRVVTLLISSFVNLNQWFISVNQTFYPNILNIFLSWWVKLDLSWSRRDRGMSSSRGLWTAPFDRIKWLPKSRWMCLTSTRWGWIGPGLQESITMK